MKNLFRCSQIRNVHHFVAESENIILLQFMCWDTQLGSTCVGRRFFSQMDEIRALSYIESLLSDIGESCIMETLQGRGSKDVPFQQHCLLRDKLRPHSCVFSISFIWAIQSVSSPSRLSLHPVLSFACVHVWAHYGNGKAANSAFKMKQRFNDFLCCFMALRGLHGVMGFIWET